MRKLVVILILFSQTAFTQKDSGKAINNFYLEFSVGGGVYNNNEDYFDINQPYLKNEFSLCFISKLYFKNKWLRSGINYSFFYYTPPSYSLEMGLNLFSKDAYPQYLGPSIAYGYSIDNGKNLGQRFVIFGFDYFYNKFHVAANYQWIAFENAPFRKGIFKTTNIYLEIGYSFNLESFRKKQ